MAEPDNSQPLPDEDGAAPPSRPPSDQSGNSSGTWVKADEWAVPQTRWSIVLKAARGPVTEEAESALRELCVMYWRTLYRLARKKGQDDQAARDSVQDLVSSLLANTKNLSAVDPEKGKFRSFLWRYFENYMKDQYRATQTKKRGGDRIKIAIDSEVYLEPVDGLTPENVYSKSYALDTFRAVLDDLEAAWVAGGKAKRFHLLIEYLATDFRKERESVLAETLEISASRARGAVCELRKQFRSMLRERIAQSLSNPSRSNIDDEVEQFWHDLNL